MEQIRSFIAIELPEELKREISQLETQLKTSGLTRVKWVNPDNIHLTLKFLGDIGIDRVGDVTKVIEEAVRVIPPFSLKVINTGVFPNVKRAQVAWLGLSGDINGLLQLHQHIESRLENLGFAPESRAFTPHLTLARLHQGTTHDHRQQFGHMVTNTGFEAASIIKVTTVSLMKSQLSREGAIYSRLASMDLKN
ncbi:RNA 2',3'-cyclic phosphodiesterase [Chloroflexota bacterium]